MSTQKTYTVRKLPNGKFSHIVLSLIDLRIDEYLNDIEFTLKSKKVIGAVAFDLLIINGINDRFYTADFNGSKFILTSFKPLKNNFELLNKTSNKFFSKHIEFINNSNIPSAKKFIIKKQLEKATA